MSVAGRSARLTAAVVMIVGTLVVGAARPAYAADPPAGASWYETYIDTPDGQRLHVDVMRPKGLDDDDKTPAILVVSPYLGMTSQTEQPGPSNRFYDFYEGAKVFRRGYSVVQVSLRGTGGSSGCLDILGPGEQIDIETAVEWTTSQPWSTGRVGMYGKSYDANTGVAAAALRPKGLAAVVAQQIVPDRYRGSYSDRVRYLQSLAYPGASYGAQGEGMFSVYNDQEYVINSTSHTADCQAGLAGHYLDDPTSEFWTIRDFAERAKGSKVPTFITTGYLDANTNVGGGVIDFFNALKGPKRMWIGWWDHVRGSDKVGERLAMGRKGFNEEVMRFFDRYVKGLPAAKAPTHRDPLIAAQSSDGAWRSEKAWPPKDARMVAGPLLEGSYVDDARNVGSNDAAAGPGGSGSAGEEAIGYGSWTFSPPLKRSIQVAGVPAAAIKLVTTAPRTNVVVNVYDVAPNGSATMITRGAALADEAGVKKVAMYPTDWIFERGHRIGLLVSGANAEAYVHTPTNTTVEVAGGGVRLPYLPSVRKSNLQGAPAPRLETWLSTAPFTVDKATIAERTNKAFKPPY
ncbi:MAG TPA: CocE/NonD family hydrolase [Actinomycetota bacterium]